MAWLWEGKVAWNNYAPVDTVKLNWPDEVIYILFFPPLLNWFDLDRYGVLTLISAKHGA